MDLPIEIKFKKLDDGAILPEYATNLAAAVDLRCILKGDLRDAWLQPGHSVMLSTGLAMEMPKGVAALILPRSGLASKKGLRPANTPGLIDADYRGEIKICLYNDSAHPQSIKNNERIAQMMFIPYIKGSFSEVNELSETERGNGGFGSTGEH